MLHQGNTENLVIKSGPQKQPQAITPNTNLVRCILQRQIETGRNQGLNDSPQRINRGSGMSAAPLEASRNVGDVRQATKDVPTPDSLGESTETESGSKNRQDSEQPCNELVLVTADNPTLTAIRTSTRQKRKTRLALPSSSAGPARKQPHLSRQRDRPQERQKLVTKNRNGVYEIQVHYAESLNMAAAYGISPSDVAHTIQEDNLERAKLAKGKEVDEEMVDIDSGTDDDLDSEME